MLDSQREDGDSVKGLVDRPESADMRDGYHRRLQNEIAHYEKIYAGRMSQEVPEVWYKVEQHFADAIEHVTGVRNLYQYVARHVAGRRSVRVLGVGSGACGNELDGIAPLLAGQGCQMQLTCIDINDNVLNQARIEAEKRFVTFHARAQDVNTLALEPEGFDVVVAYASLHHFVELDHIAREIARGLTPDGIFVTVDIPTRNGYLMWDETFEIVGRLWQVLPPKFKIAHTGFNQPTHVPTYENIDYSKESFECINSEAILPSLRRQMTELDYVPALSIARRFFDTKFGPNYDLERPLDRRIFEFIMALDNDYIEKEILRPETFFGAYRRKA